jgi:hypothetical protein
MRLTPRLDAESKRHLPATSERGFPFAIAALPPKIQRRREPKSSGGLQGQASTAFKVAFLLIAA